MLVKEVMTRPAEVIGANETLQEAARRMRGAGIGALAVSDGGRLIGVITDRDIVVRATAEAWDPAATRVRSAMTAQVISCSPDDDLARAAAVMGEHAVRRIFVLDPAERPVGMLSVDDVALHSRPMAGQVIERTSVPERPAVAGPWPWWE